MENFKNVLNDLNTSVKSNSSNEIEVNFEYYKSYILGIILSTENMLYKLFCDLKLEKNLKSSEAEEMIFEYIREYLIKYIQNLETKTFTTLDSNFFNKIKNITTKKVEDLINMVYPCLDRDELVITSILDYNNSISEQVNEIFEIKKLEIFDII